MANIDEPQSKPDEKDLKEKSINNLEEKLSKDGNVDQDKMADQSNDDGIGVPHSVDDFTSIKENDLEKGSQDKKDEKTFPIEKPEQPSNLYRVEEQDLNRENNMNEGNLLYDDDLLDEDERQEKPLVENKNYNIPKQRKKPCMGSFITLLALLLVGTTIAGTIILFLNNSWFGGRTSKLITSIEDGESQTSDNVGNSPPTIGNPNTPNVNPTPSTPNTPNTPSGNPPSQPNDILDGIWRGNGRVINEQYKRISRAILSGDGSAFGILFPNFTNKPSVVKIKKIDEGGIFDIGSEIKATEGGLDDNMLSLAMNGKADTVVISFKSSNKGYVQVYRLVLGDWLPDGDIIVSEKANNNFGDSIAMSEEGNRFIVGANLDNSGRGAVFIYDFDDDVWLRNNKVLRGTRIGELFGTSLDISGDGSKIAVSYNALNPTDSTLENIQVYVTDSERRFVNYGDIITRYSPPEPFYASSLSLSSSGDTIAVANGRNTEALPLSQVHEISPSNTWLPKGSSFVGDGVDISGDGKLVVVTSFQEKTTTTYLWTTKWQQLGNTFPGLSQVESTAGISVSSDGSQMMIVDHLTLNPNVGLRSRIRLFKFIVEE